MTNKSKTAQTQKPSKHNTRLKSLVALITFIFALNLFTAMFPLHANAQEESIAEIVISSFGGALTLPCTHNSFELDPIHIDEPTDFTSYYLNPKIAPDPTQSPTCIPIGQPDDPTGITVQDTRFNGGFVLQVEATTYTDTVDPLKTIAVNNLAVVTEQANTSYTEDNTGTNTYSGSGTNLLTGSTGDNVEAAYTLPFDFEFYGTTYTSGSSIYLCSNGSINFNSGQCGAPPANLEDIFIDTGQPRILPYFKDLTTNTGIDPSFGIYAEPVADEVRFLWKAAPTADTGQRATFEVLLTNNEAKGETDSITFNYSSGMTDTGEGPVVGVTKGGPLLDPPSATYTDSTLNQLTPNPNNRLNGKTALFTTGLDFTEVKVPGTASVIAPSKGDPATEADYWNFPDGGGSGTVDLLNGDLTQTPACEGRVGLYTIYPSYKLVVPSDTEEGDYESVITYTVYDSTTTDPACVI